MPATHGGNPRPSVDAERTKWKKLRAGDSDLRLKTSEPQISSQISSQTQPLPTGISNALPNTVAESALSGSLLPLPVGAVASP